MSRRLIVNADDFGFTRDVNRGIIDAHRNGILTATTLMANGAAFEDAVPLSGAAPGLDVGVHCVLVGGRSVRDPSRALPPTVKDMLAAIITRRLDPYAELRAQIEKILAAGIRPTHLDTHKHTHLFPPVLNAVARLGKEFGIPWIRRPLDFPLSARGVPLSKRLLSRSMGLLRKRFHRVLLRNGCRTTDYFAGFQLTGRFHTAELIDLLQQLPDGMTEFMTHPGYCTGELEGARTRLKRSRQLELEALTAPETRAALVAFRIELVGFRQPAGDPTY
ncbi:MAG: ChbG/HpnK family deacetylase [Bryobacterales bacterium]|nr:ChbG/HpnK family deacetylase [Bryobacterales bacterium]